MTQPLSGLRPDGRSHGAPMRAFALFLATLLLPLGLAATALGAVPMAPKHARAVKAHVGERATVRQSAAGRERTKARSGLKKTVAARKLETSARRRRAVASAADRPRPALKRAAVAPAKVVPAGGELTEDEFFRVAGASPEARPEARVDASEAAAEPPVAKAFAEADVPARIATLTHPSHEQLANDAAEPVVLPGLYRNGRLVVPPPLKGSREILVHQNQMADDEGLERVRNDAALNKLRAGHQLVDFPETASLHVNPELGAQRRCARVWTVRFAEDMARSYYARFHEPLQVSSAVRTIAYQLRLQRTNGNAAGVGGEAASPHLTGQAVDFGKSGMSIEEIAWMRAYLKPLMDAGKVDVEEEFQQACFHISVYKSYLPAARRGVAEVAQMRKPLVVESVGR